MFLCAAAVARADWENVGPGVDYQEFKRGKLDIHVTRVDLTDERISVVVTREADKGTRVSEFGKKYKAIAAINGDYFDDKFNPIGKTVGPCGPWESARLTKRESLLAIGDDRAVLSRQTEVDPKDPAPEWASTAISGWPALVLRCDPLAAKSLPGSDAFTRAPHPRTAVGLSKDRKTLYLVVADGRRANIPGVTLAELGAFMSDELGACWAMNLDGGGSSAMWLRDRIINRPSDGVERPVGNHLGVALREDLVACDPDDEIKTTATTRITTTTTTTRTTTTTTRPPL